MGTTIHSGDGSRAWTLYAGVFLISLSLLMLEIGCIRVFSVMFETHYAFLIISLAILGLGSGGVYLHKRMVRVREPEPEFFRNYMEKASILMALSIVLLSILILRIPLFQHLYSAALLAFIPFFAGGLFFASAFRSNTRMSAYLYAADLTGASLGSLGMVALMRMGGIRVILLIAFLASLPACFMSQRHTASTFKKISPPLLTAGLLLTFMLFGGSMGPIPFSTSAHKEMAHLMAHPAGKATLIASRWSSFGRTDLVMKEGRDDERVFFIDGTAGTSMYAFDKDMADLDRRYFKHFSGYFPFEILPESRKQKVLIIGSGGGREVLVSLLGGAKDITAVEVNRDLVELMNENEDFNGGIYDGYPGVKVVVEEGRNFIRSTEERYDIIMLSIPITKTSRSPEGYALTENFLFTVESFADYLDHLGKEGQLIVVAHEDVEIFRLVFTALETLRRRGIPHEEAMKYLYTVGPDMFPVFVLQKRPFTRAEAEAIHESMHEHAYNSLSSFIPFLEQTTHKMSMGEGIYQEERMLNEALYLISRGKVAPAQLAQMANIDLSAATDDSPFFYKFNIGLPFVISFLLILSLIALVATWMVKPEYLSGNASPGRNAQAGLLFSFLGIGFMLIEIPLIQKFTLFLGRPTYSIALLLFSLLVGAGFGSWISGSVLKSDTLFKLRVASGLAGILAGLYTLFLNPFFTAFLGASFLARVTLSIGLLLPLGFFLGMPFPLGMKLLDELGLNHYVPRMWGINGIGSVLGSALAIALAISYGLSYALFLGMALYFVVLVLFSTRSTTERERVSKRK